MYHRLRQARRRGKMCVTSCIVLETERQILFLCSIYRTLQSDKHSIKSAKVNTDEKD